MAMKFFRKLTAIAATAAVIAVYWNPLYTAARAEEPEPGIRMNTIFSASITFCFFFGAVILPAFYPTVLELMISPIRPISGDGTTGRFRSSPAYVFTLVSTICSALYVRYFGANPEAGTPISYRAGLSWWNYILSCKESFIHYALRYWKNFTSTSYHGTNINQLISFLVYNMGVARIWFFFE